MAGPLCQGWGLGVALRSRAALRPLGLLAPPARGVLGPGTGTATGSGEAALEENPFYGKYRHKIQELRRSSPDVFESRMEKRSEVKRQPVGHSKQGEFIRCMEEKASTISKGGFTKDKTLDSILNVEMVKEKSAEEITQIWNQYFSAKDTVYAVIPADKFDLMWKRAQNCPSFLYALPRKEGYEFFVGQWSGTELHFTSLINVQTQGETAPSQLVLYHYPDLQKEKGIVLMTAEMDSKFLVVHDAQCLANQVQLFYATDRSETYGLVETFNHRSSEFKYMSVIAELEQSGLGRELRPGQASDKS
ncbi:ATP synthase mitochondrial F1 complex assembly factor 1 isoform X2 [Cinclus cinclus]|uniref:ATP synthase mitochondrial F1 complex assembly factor 1 isoform X2 n=1 Tax=Cinclus cinclus TaxID=127875 RepID=UPI002E15C642